MESNDQNSGYKTLIQLKREQEGQRKARYKSDCKQRLKTIINKKIQTTMIGALDTIEKNLGFLWAQNDSGYMSEDAKYFRGIYEIIRQEILDRGNGQIRNVDAELEQYDIEWLRYHLTLPIKRRNRTDEKE
jgi:transcription termination factor Rho